MMVDWNEYQKQIVANLAQIGKASPFEAKTVKSNS